jgi:fluoride exporter
VILALVSLGGGLGGLARYLLSLAVPGAWGILLINVLGSFLIGVLMERAPSQATRAFFGVGVLGGFTTFSAYAVDLSWFLVATPVCAFAATYLGMRLVRWKR